MRQPRKSCESGASGPSAFRLCCGGHERRGWVEVKGVAPSQASAVFACRIPQCDSPRSLVRAAPMAPVLSDIGPGDTWTCTAVVQGGGHECCPTPALRALCLYSSTTKTACCCNHPSLAWFQSVSKLPSTYHKRRYQIGFGSWWGEIMNSC